MMSTEGETPTNRDENRGGEENRAWVVECVGRWVSVLALVATPQSDARRFFGHVYVDRSVYSGTLKRCTAVTSSVWILSLPMATVLHMSHSLRWIESHTELSPQCRGSTHIPAMICGPLMHSINHICVYVCVYV